MNTYMKNQCNNMLSSVTIFLKSCEMAAQQDDDKVSAAEQKVLDKLRKASERYTKQIQKIID